MSWNNYKRTFKVESECFDLARAGQTSELRLRLMSLDSINQKNAKGHSVLMLAAYSGHVETTQALLNHGADPNSIDLTGSSILMGVAFKGHTEIAKLLLKAGADPNYQNDKSQTALLYAEMFARKEIVELLSGKKRNDFQGLRGTIGAWAKHLMSKKRGESK